MSRSRHVEPEEPENHERWLVSYADFITLLFAFFVVMFAVSRVDNSRLTQAANALRFALHFEGTGGVGALPLFEGPPSEGSCKSKTGDGKRSNARTLELLETLRKRLQKELGPLLQDRSRASLLSIHLEGRRLALRLSAARFFEPSGSALLPQALPVADAVAHELAALERPVRVEGHTDDQPVRAGRWRDNWELSAARAAAVASYFQDAHHVRPELLTAAGLADTRPMAPNDTEAGREANRRIEIVIELAPTDPAAEAGY